MGMGVESTTGIPVQRPWRGYRELHTGTSARGISSTKRRELTWAGQYRRRGTAPSCV